VSAPPAQDPPPRGEADARVAPDASPAARPTAGGSPAEPDGTEGLGAARGQLPTGLFQRLRQARRALTVIRGYAFVGAVLAVALFAASFLTYEREIPRWICRLGAMGVLLSAVVGLNVMERLVHGKSLPATSVAIALALIAVALLGVGVGAVRYELGGAWSPLTAATYVVVGVRIMLRFRSPASEPRV